MKKSTLFVFLIVITNSFAQRLFYSLGVEATGVDFENQITETEAFNFFHFDYFYNGGGVAVGDINNDGLKICFL